MVADKLNVIHLARKSFILAESSEKIKRVLCQKVKTSTALKYRKRDLVYFKGKKSNHWMEQRTVIEAMFRVHPCHLQMYNNDSVEELNGPPIDGIQFNMENLEGFMGRSR